MLTKFSGPGLYVHVPFCLSKCDYCGFYSIIPDSDYFELYLRQLEIEAAERLSDVEKTFKTCFVGGGNPTSMCTENFKRFVKIITNKLPANIVEFTFESNPETLTQEIIDIMADLPGIRLSMGVQRLKDEELRILGRKSSIYKIYKALELAFSRLENVSVDFIMGVPDCPSLADDLSCFISRFPMKHVSAYFLSIEPGSLLQKKVESGALPDPQNIDASELFEVRNVLLDAGFEHYEVSNYALPGKRCEHNMNYWHTADYTGIGPSAVSTVSSVRTENINDFQLWLSGGKAETEYLSDIDCRNEYLMLQLRLLKDGLSLTELGRRFGKQTDLFYADVIENIKLGYLYRKDENISLTDNGLVIADRVIGSLFL